MSISSMFDQVGSLIDNFNPNNSPSQNLGIANVVAPQPRQLGNAIPAQPGSLATITNNPNSPQQLAVKPSAGLLPQKTTAQLHQDNIAANQNVAKATAAAVKHATTQTGGGSLADMVGGPGTSSVATTPASSAVGQGTPAVGSITPVSAPASSPIVGSTGSGTNSTQTLPIDGSTTGDTATNGIIDTPPQTQNQQAVSGLLNQANGSPQVAQANQNLLDFQKRYATEMQGVDEVGGDLNSATGQQGIINNKYAQELPAYQTAVSNALQGQGQQITAGTNAESATHGVSVAPADTYTNPQTGLPVNSGSTSTSGLNANAQASVDSLTSSVLSGSISYQDAVNQLSGFGPNAPTALLNAIKAQNPNFNVNQANAQSSAQESNTTLAGTTNALIDKANGALSSLPDLLNALSPIQTTGSGLLGQWTNGLSDATGIGATATRAYQAQLGEARAAVNAVLNSAVNLGVVTGGTTANSLLPDNMSAAGLKKNIGIIQNLMQQTKDALAKLSNASPTSSNSTGSNAFGNTFQ